MTTRERLSEYAKVMKDMQCISKYPLCRFDTTWYPKLQKRVEFVERGKLKIGDIDVVKIQGASGYKFEVEGVQIEGDGQ